MNPSIIICGIFSILWFVASCFAKDNVQHEACLTRSVIAAAAALIIANL